MTPKYNLKLNIQGFYDAADKHGVDLKCHHNSDDYANDIVWDVSHIMPNPKRWDHKSPFSYYAISFSITDDNSGDFLVSFYNKFESHLGSKEYFQDALVQRIWQEMSDTANYHIVADHKKYEDLIKSLQELITASARQHYICQVAS